MSQNVLLTSVKVNEDGSFTFWGHDIDNNQYTFRKVFMRAVVDFPVTNIHLEGEGDEVECKFRQYGYGDNAKRKI